MKLSAVIVSRNDDYGGHLVTRARICINTMLDAFDEVIYVDWNSPNGKPLTDEFKIDVNPDRLKVIVVTNEKARQLLGEKYNSAQPCCEVLARNIGIRRATGDYIVSTNIDIVCPRRSYIEETIKMITPDQMATITRHDINREGIENLNLSYQEIRDLVCIHRGVDSIQSKQLIDIIYMDKCIYDQISQKMPAAALIANCGDFQIAHKDLWFKIKGFEESLSKRLYSDGHVQYKVIAVGGSVRSFNMPPVYHISHYKNDAHEINDDVDWNGTTQNSDDWGFANENF